VISLLRSRLARIDRRTLHRVAALFVFALQVAVAVSPVWEERPGVRLGAHAEEQGSTQHAAQHNEASCIVCAARNEAQTPASPMPEIAFYSPAFAPLARTEYAPVDISPVTSQSRAPPIL
jgi:hypothetical protein